MQKKVFFAVPAYKGIRCVPFYNSLEATIKYCEEVGYKTNLSVLQGSCYVQTARNELVKAFLETNCDTLFFLDDDISWDREDALKLINMDDDIVAGIYPYKTEEEGYPVVIHTTDDNRPLTRTDGCIHAAYIPFGFVRIKRHVIEKLIKAYQSLKYYKPCGFDLIEFTDLFPQGVQGERWVGEDYAFCNLWHGLNGSIFVVPDIDLIHHGEIDGKPKEFKGNYHRYLLKQPGGSDFNETDYVEKYKGNTIDGWLTIAEQQFLFDNASKYESVVEIGSYKGKSAVILLESKAKKVYCVDHWKTYGDMPHDSQDDAENRYAEFLRNVSKYNNNGKLKVIRDDSIKASLMFDDKSLDMVFIDAAHDEESVKNDIRAWLPKTKKLICGHDYAYYWPGVKKAVDDIFGSKVKKNDSIWYVELDQ